MKLHNKLPTKYCMSILDFPIKVPRLYIRVLGTLENLEKSGTFLFGLENLEKSGNFFEPTPKIFFFTKKVFIHKDFSHFRRGNLKIFSNHDG